MIRFQRIRLFPLGLFLLAVGACASGPDKPDPLSTLHAEDGDTKALTEVDATKSDAERSSDGAIPFGGPDMVRPTQGAGPTPWLPPEAIANHVTGTWIARCIITEKGSVEGCKIVKGLPYSDEHIIQVLYAQKYTPVIFEGKPQGVFYTFKITFK